MAVSSQDDRLMIGVITAPHGVRGQIKIKPFTEDISLLTHHGPVSLSDGRSLQLKQTGAAKGQLICSAAEIRDRNTAETLKGAELFIDRAVLPDLADDEVYQADLLGAEVVDSQHGSIGRCIGFFDFGAGPLIEVKPDKGQSLFLPFHSQVIEALDLSAGVIRLVLPHGLVNEPEDDPEESPEEGSA